MGDDDDFNLGDDALAMLGYDGDDPASGKTGDGALLTGDASAGGGGADSPGWLRGKISNPFSGLTSTANWRATSPGTWGNYFLAGLCFAALASGVGAFYQFVEEERYGNGDLELSAVGGVVAIACMLGVSLAQHKRSEHDSQPSIKPYDLDAYWLALITLLASAALTVTFAFTYYEEIHNTQSATASFAGLFAPFAILGALSTGFRILFLPSN